jgi:hypothetical protein
MGVMEKLGGQGELMQIVFALNASSGFPSLLDGRQQQAHQHSDD